MKNLTQARALGTYFPVVLLAVVGIAMGSLLAGSGNVMVAIMALGVLGGIVLLLKPVLSLWSVLIGGLVVTGFTQLYVPQLQFIRWAVALLASILGIIAIANYVFRNRSGDRAALPSVIWWMLAFIGVALASSFVNFENADTLIYGLKGYLQVLGILFAIVLMGWDGAIVDRIPKLLVGVALIQFPFVLHQYLYLVPARVGLGNGIVAEDVIAGTLGASATGGGANAVLSLLLLIATSLLLALYRRKQVSGAVLSVCLVILLVPVMLNSNRISLFYLLMIYLMLFSRDLLKAPAKAIAMGALFVLIIGGVFWSYSKLLSNSQPSSGWEDFIAHTFEQNTSAGFGYGHYQLNRWTSVTFWVQEHRHAPLSTLLLGHGAGAARDAEGGAISADTLAQRDYAGVGIGLTTVSAVLWELGIIGLACLLAVMIVAFRSAGRLATFYDKEPYRAAMFQGLRVGIALFAVSLIHKSSLTFHLPYQTLLLMVLGYIGYWDAKSRMKSADQAVQHSGALKLASGVKA
jgi:hypothetical protein